METRGWDFIRNTMLNTLFIIEFVSITSVLGKTASANMEKLKLSRKIT